MHKNKMGNDKYEQLKRDVIDAVVGEEMQKLITVTTNQGFKPTWIAFAEKKNLGKRKAAELPTGETTSPHVCVWCRQSCPP